MDRFKKYTNFAVLTIFSFLFSMHGNTSENDDNVKFWTDRVIPMPHEVKLLGKVKTTASRIVLETSAIKAIQMANAKKLIMSFALGKSDSSSQIIIKFLLKKNAAGVLPENVINRLGGLPGKEQAYVIYPEKKENRLYITLAGNTPTGLLYAAQTLKMLVRPPQNIKAETVLTIPEISITDWPDIVDRGEWGGYHKWDYPWYGKWKLNLIEINPILGIDKTGKPIIRITRKKIEEGAEWGIKVIPFIPHLASIGGNANLRSALYNQKLKHLLPVLGKPLNSDNGLSYGNPQTVELITNWAMQLRKLVDGYHKELEIWLTEGGRHCKFDIERTNGKPKLAETEFILKVYERVKKKYPDTHLRIWLSQGSYNEKVHDEIAKMLPPGAGLIYYNGTKTYISDRKPMIPENLAKFSQKGGYLGVVPQISHSWITVLPWTAPQFVHFRMKEFAGKKLNSVSAYAVPGGRCFHSFNLIATTEWTWNINGRTPKEFAKAYATVKGMKNPDIFAEWAMKVGSAGWEIADSLLFASMNYDPALGFHGDKPYDHRFAYENTYQSNMKQAMKNARKALKLAESSGNPDMINESVFVLNGLKVITLTSSIGKKLRAAKLSLKEQKEMAKELDQLDECAQKIAVNTYAWGKRQMPDNPRYVHGTSRLENIIWSLMKCCEVFRDMAGTRGIVDPRQDLRPVELGEWKTSDFKHGRAVFSYDITDLISRKGKWKFYGIDIQNLNGFTVYLLNFSLWKINGKTGIKEKFFDMHSLKQYRDVWRKLTIFPEPENIAGDKIILKIYLNVICPKANEFPNYKKLHGKGTQGMIYFRRIISPDKLNVLRKTTLGSGNSTAVAVFKRSLKGEKTSVAVLAGYGAEEITKTINRERDINAVLLPKLSAKSLSDYQVLIVTQSKNTTQIIKYAKLIQDWVKSGSGAFFIHDAVGIRRLMPLFRSIGRGKNNPKLRKVKVVRKHPVTANLEVGRFFSPGFLYDHIDMYKGPNGTSLLENEEGNPVLVAGRFGRGRVVLNGMMTGLKSSKANAGGYAAVPEAEELTILLNSIRWLAGERNLLPDPHVKNPVKRERIKLPVAEGWGKCQGCGDSGWGATDKLSKSGKNSMFLKFRKYYTVKRNGKERKDFGAGLFIGAEDNSGKNAVKVEPDTNYGFSFWLKGDPKIKFGIGAVTWDKKGRRVIFHPVKDPVNLHINGILMGDPVMRRGIGVQARKLWNHYSGTFRTKTDTEKASVRIYIYDEGNKLNLKGGETVYVDDAEIFKME